MGDFYNSYQSKVMSANYHDNHVCMYPDGVWVYDKHNTTISKFQIGTLVADEIGDRLPCFVR